MINSTTTYLLLFCFFCVITDSVFAQNNNQAALSITSQPATTVVPKNGTATLSCTAAKGDAEISYQWYLHTDESDSKIEEATENTYTTEIFAEKGIKYYYCKVSCGDESITSEVVAVAYTGLATLYISTENGEEPTAVYTYPPEGCYGRGIKNATKVKSSMQILDGNGIEIYNSGEYNKKQKTGLTIKLRGNTSASLTGKTPYKLKLQTEEDLLHNLNSRDGNEYKDKDWILLANGTSLNTFVGLSVTDIAGAPWTPEFAYVDVVINDDYRGIYMLIESIERSEKRVDVSENGYIIERDAYWWNEDVKFITSRYNQKYTFKYPDDEDITVQQYSYIENYMNTLEEHVAKGTYDDYLDTESFARWLLIHDILGTWDSYGSNMYMYKYDDTENTKIYMSTNWDFDSNYMMEDSWANQHDGSRIYAKYLFQSTNRNFVKQYVDQWNGIRNTLYSNITNLLGDLQNQFGTSINLSRELDAIRWNYTTYTIENDIQIASNWFESRIKWLDNAIISKHTITYNLDGGKFEPGKENPKEYGFDDIITLYTPVKDGYEFIGWTYDDITSPQINVAFYGYNTITDLNFSAVWQKNTEQFTPVSEITPHNNIKIWSYEKRVFVENAESEIIIVDMSGRIVNRIKPNNDHMEIQLSNDGIYIVKTGLNSQKILIK